MTYEEFKKKYESDLEAAGNAKANEYNKRLTTGDLLLQDQDYCYRVKNGSSAVADRGVIIITGKIKGPYLPFKEGEEPVFAHDQVREVGFISFRVEI